MGDGLSDRRRGVEWGEVQEMSAAKGLIGVDLDGTLAEYSGWKGAEHVGKPVPAMLARVKAMLAEGRDVRIFTARAWHDGTPGRMEESAAACRAIQAWCERHVGQKLVVTNVKDYAMVELWDDRAVQVVPNTGERADRAAAVECDHKVTAFDLLSGRAHCLCGDIHRAMTAEEWGSV